MRVVHLLRPAQGGMLEHVRALLSDPAHEALIAAPPRELAALGTTQARPSYPLTESLGGRHQLLAGRAVGRWACTAGAQVLHGHGLKWLPLFVVAAWTARLPLVITLHNLVPAQTPFFLPWLLRQAKAVVAVSQAVAKSAPVPTRVIYNGIDLAPFSNLPSREEARAQLGWPKEATIVLSVARLSFEKGLDVLQEAVQGTGLTLKIAGEGPERERLDPETLLGRRDDVPLLLAAADLYCQPSRQEGLGMAILEAMAAGLPIVASAVGGIPELLPDRGVGLLVPAEEVGALRAALCLLESEAWQRRDMGRFARQRVAERFTLEQQRTELTRLYEQVCR